MLYLTSDSCSIKENIAPPVANLWSPIQKLVDHFYLFLKKGWLRGFADINSFPLHPLFLTRCPIKQFHLLRKNMFLYHFYAPHRQNLQSFPSVLFDKGRVERKTGGDLRFPRHLQIKPVAEALPLLKSKQWSNNPRGIGLQANTISTNNASGQHGSLLCVVRTLLMRSGANGMMSGSAKGVTVRVRQVRFVVVAYLVHTAAIFLFCSKLVI